MPTSTLSSSRRLPPTVLYLGGGPPTEQRQRLDELSGQVDELKRLIELQSAQIHQLQQQQLDEAQSSTANADDADDAELTDTADASDTANMYSYCTHVALSTEHSWQERFQAVICISFLMSVQIMFVYGFIEGASLSSLLDTHMAYGEPIHMSLFYAWSVIDGTETPLLNALASLASLLLLSLSIKNDTEGTLLSGCPAARVCFGDGTRLKQHRKPHERQPVKRTKWTAMKEVGRLLLILYLQLMWSARSLILPILATLGTGSVLAADHTLRDIVLDSISIAFVFEIDEFVYLAAISSAKRSAFERNPPSRTSPLSDFHNPEGQLGARALVGRHCWVSYVVDVAFTWTFYLQNIHQRDKRDDRSRMDWANFYMGILRDYCFVRLCLMVVANIHILLHIQRTLYCASKRAFLKRAAVFSMLVTCIGLFTFFVCRIFMAHWFEMSWDPMIADFKDPFIPGEVAYACLESDDPEYCHQYHTRPDIYQIWRAHDRRDSEDWFNLRLRRYLGIDVY